MDSINTANIRHEVSQRGSILISTLLVLMVVNLLAIGLMQTSAKETRLSMFKTIDSSVFHIADSCVQDSIKWLSDQTTPPNTLPNVITETNLDHMLTGTESSSVLGKLTGYSYNCTTSDIITLSVSGDDMGIGDEIGETAGYGAAGDLSPRYYYGINSSAQGPQNSTNTIVATVSVEY